MQPSVEQDSIQQCVPIRQLGTTRIMQSMLFGGGDGDEGWL